MNFITNAFLLPLDNDYSWVQLLTGVNWLIASYLAFGVKWNSSYFWIIFSSFLFFCSLDEHFMIHECLKYSGIFGEQLVIKDWIILLYGVGAFFGAFYFYKKIIETKKQKIILLLMILFVATIVSNDVFDLSFFTLSNAAEECAELILSSVVIYFISSFPDSNFSMSKKITIFSSLITLYIILGLIVRLLVWPRTCPQVINF